MDKKEWDMGTKYYRHKFELSLLQNLYSTNDKKEDVINIGNNLVHFIINI